MNDCLSNGLVWCRRAQSTVGGKSTRLLGCIRKLSEQAREGASKQHSSVFPPLTSLSNGSIISNESFPLQAAIGQSVLLQQEEKTTTESRLPLFCPTQTGKHWDL